MPITMNDLTINSNGVDMDQLLSEWTWAMPEPLRPVLLTAMGDVFAQGESGHPVTQTFLKSETMVSSRLVRSPPKDAKQVGEPWNWATVSRTYQS